MKLNGRWMLIILFVLVLGWTTWMYRFSGPDLTLFQGDTGPELANIFWGEYYLDLHQLKITDLGSGELVVEATAQDEQYVKKKPYSVPIGLKHDLRRALESSGWVIQGSIKPVSLLPGRRYKIEVRGNNGFGYSNRTSRVVVAGQG